MQLSLNFQTGRRGRSRLDGAWNLNLETVKIVLDEFEVVDGVFRTSRISAVSRAPVKRPSPLPFFPPRAAPPLVPVRVRAASVSVHGDSNADAALLGTPHYHRSPM